MAIFRIEKTKDFTIMSNHHLRNQSLSLKAKGLQSLMLSLPEAWDYSQKGLAAICKEGVDSISAALQELEAHGYLTRRQIRDDKGKYLDLEYTIHEIPVEPVDNPVDNSPPGKGQPIKDYPKPENPVSDKPVPENTGQLITNNQVFKKSRTDSLNIDQSIRADATDTMDAIDIYRQILKENIAYDALCFDHKHDREEIDEILELMLETVCSSKKTIRISGEDKPAEVVKSQMMKLNQFHIEYLLETLGNNTTDVRNIRSYLLTSLYNAPATMSNHYKQRVQHDFYGNK